MKLRKGQPFSKSQRQTKENKNKQKNNQTKKYNSETYLHISRLKKSRKEV